MTASDQQQLETELNYKPVQHDTRFFKTHPPGYNVMIGLGAFFGLVGFLLGSVVTVSVLGRGGVGEIAGCLVGLVVAFTLGWTLPRAFWRGIGPHGRAVLRVPGHLGAWAILVPCFLISAGLVVGLKGVVEAQIPTEAAPSVKETPTVPAVGPLSGPDWQVLVDGNNEPLSLTLAEAHAHAEKLGEGWRLPRLTDQRFIINNITNPKWKSCVFHFDNVGNYHGHFYFGESVDQWCSAADMEDLPRHVLCLRTP